jgi:hypothetical protein
MLQYLIDTTYNSLEKSKEIYQGSQPLQDVW